jgi:hypothetical protein
MSRIKVAFMVFMHLLEIKTFNLLTLEIFEI